MLWRDQNPFAGKFQSPLEPERENEIENLYAFVDGLRGAKPQIDAWCSSTAQTRSKPFVALISGPKGSGKSSVANYVAYRCAWVNRGNLSENVEGGLLKRCRVLGDVRDEHPIVPCQTIMNKYFTLVTKQGIKVDSFVMDKMINISTMNNVEALSALYAIMRGTTSQIATPIFFMRGIRRYDQLANAAQIIGGDGILICTTPSKAVAEDFSKAISENVYGSLQFELSKLEPTDVVELYEHRWSLFAEDPAATSPIDRATIISTFVHGWSIRGVVIVLEDLLSGYVTTWGKNGSTPQPGITEKEIKDRIIALLIKRTADILG
jgi:hypothetical protein